MPFVSMTVNMQNYTGNCLIDYTFRSDFNGGRRDQDRRSQEIRNINLQDALNDIDRRLRLINDRPGANELASRIIIVGLKMGEKTNVRRTK